MKQGRWQKIILLILSMAVLAETAWIMWMRTARNAAPEEQWDFAVDRELSEDFDRALSDGRIEVWFQPITDPVSGDTVGAEALSRWRQGDEYISPSVFISVLEATGQVRDLDRYVFQTVCAFQKERLNEGIDPVPVSVNLSVVSGLQEGVAAEYAEISRAFDLPAGCVNIEVTESLDSDREVFSALVDEFHEAGFLVEIDDFGAGYAAYANLAVIPYDVLKIDKSLVDAVDTEKGARLTADLLRMAEDFGMKTIAEGVETAEQVSWLQAAGCDAIQGYYYSRPLPPEAFIAYLDK